MVIIAESSIVRLDLVSVVFNEFQNCSKPEWQHVEVDVVGKELVWMDKGESCRSGNDCASAMQKFSK